MSLKVFKQLLGKHVNNIIVSGDKIDMALSQQQKILLDKILNSNKNIFITCRAGTGKSFLVKRLLKESKKYDVKNVEKSPFKFTIESNRFPDIDLDDNHSQTNDYIFNELSNKQCHHCGSQNVEKGYYKNEFFCQDCKDGGDIKLLFNSLGKSQSNKDFENNMLKELSRRKSLKKTKKSHRDKMYKKIQQNR